MADRRVTFVLQANIKNFTKGLDSAQKKFSRFGRDMKRKGADLTRNITAPLGILGGIAIKTAADFETLRQSMDVLNGSAEEGARNFERLKRFSAETPFQLQDLASAQNMLQGFSLSADEAFASMSMIGDIAAVTGGDIKGIGMAFGQAAAEGRLMTRDIRQLINQGVPAIQMLADTMDVATSEVLDLASEGKITFDILVKAFQDATEKGGRFAKGMEKQANTLAGIWSNLKDNVEIALGELGDTIVETFDLKQLAKTITANLGVIVKRFQEMSTESKKQILKVAGLFMAGGPILFALGQASIAISAFVKFVRTRFALITLAIAGTIGVIKQWRQRWDKVFGDREKDVDNIFTATKKGMQEAMGAVMNFTEEALGMNGALSEFKKLLSGLTGAEGLKELTEDAEEATNVFSDLDLGMGSGVGGGGSAAMVTTSPIEKINKSYEDFNNTIETVKGNYNSFLLGAKKRTDWFTKAASDGIITLTETWRAKGQQFISAIAPMIERAIKDMAAGFLEGIGQMMAGAKTVGGVFQSVMSTLAQLAIRVGKIAIGVGIAIEGIKKALQSLNPIAAIAAGTALLVLGSWAKSALSKAAEGKDPRGRNRGFGGGIPGMAMGGIVPSGFPNDTYPAMLTSGEMVVPSPKSLPAGMGGSMDIKVTGELRGKGSELLAVITEAKYGRGR